VKRRKPDAVRAVEVQGYGEREPYVNVATVAAVQTVFNRTRLSHQGWESRQFSGRLDSRHAWRSDARGQVDIFRDRKMPSATKLNVHLMVDASGSMYGDNACRAQDMAATLVAAFQHIPTVNLSVWQHNASGNHATVYRVAERGIAPKLNQMLNNLAGGNADGFALEFIGQRALKGARPDEKTLVIVISDGLPSVSGKGATGNILDHSTLVARELRRKGCDVMSVAIAGDPTAHVRMYGEGNVVSFTRDWSALSRSFAATFGKVLGREARRTAHC
jgi:hypothetical protein